MSEKRRLDYFMWEYDTAVGSFVVRWRYEGMDGEWRHAYATEEEAKQHCQRLYEEVKVNGFVPHPVGVGSLVYEPLPEHARKVLDAAQARIASLESSLQEGYESAVDLYASLAATRDERDAAQARIAELIEERDEARRELCFAKATAGPEASVEKMMQYARDCAKAYGWQYLYEQEKK